ncbi:MAG TPA: acyl-CoA dehydrogenase family protein [Dehalococcoidia bacterium]|nr:acyl-CoA dehydrogenase family protein [Dehalococcoidia bacterium]
MDFELTEGQKIFREAIAQFAEKEIAPLVNEAEEKEKFPVQLFPMMGDLGYLGIAYSPEYGGADMGKMGECLAVEEFGRICMGIASGLMIQSGLATSSIYAHGSEAQKQRYLVPAIRGRKIAAFGLTEPNAGSDAAAMETRGKKDGKDYVINGNKIFISNGPIADFVVTAAYTDKSQGASGGVSLFIVDKSTPGFSVKKMHKFCLRPSETAELTYDDVRVPKENLVGEEGHGFHYLMEALAAGRISHAARSLGLAMAAYEASLEYAKNRKQFGQPIGKFQSIAFKLARMALDIEAARWLVYHAAWLYDAGKRCRKEAAMAKLFNSEAAQRVTGEAMQIHGGYGFTTDSPIQRYFRDARLGTTVEGTSEIQQLVISREIGAG